MPLWFTRHHEKLMINHLNSKDSAKESPILNNVRRVFVKTKQGHCTEAEIYIAPLPYL